MPKVTIWIREQDYEKWSAIDDKPKFLSDAINADEPKNQIQEDEMAAQMEDIFNKTKRYYNDPTYTDPEEAA